jgi:hypothetical protein
LKSSLAVVVLELDLLPTNSMLADWIFHGTLMQPLALLGVGGIVAGFGLLQLDAVKSHPHVQLK